MTERPINNLTNAGKGRKPGSKNKKTLAIQDLKESVLNVYDKRGGEKGLMAWVEASADNAKIFYGTMLTRLLPKYSDIQLSGSVTHNIGDRLLEAQNRAKELKSLDSKVIDSKPVQYEISAETKGRLIPAETAATVQETANSDTSIQSAVNLSNEDIRG